MKLTVHKTRRTAGERRVPFRYLAVLNSICLLFLRAKTIFLKQISHTTKPLTLQRFTVVNCKITRKNILQVEFFTLFHVGASADVALNVGHLALGRCRMRAEHRLNNSH